MRGLIVLIVGSSLLSACQTVSFPSDAVALSAVNSNPVQFRDEKVKVCGFATKQFENVQITESRERNWRSKDVAGLGVKWLDQEPRTDGSDQRCITGLVEPTCGWGNDIPQNIETYEAPICISTGTVFQWSIRQTELGRD